MLSCQVILRYYTHHYDSTVDPAFKGAGGRGAGFIPLQATDWLGHEYSNEVVLNALACKNCLVGTVTKTSNAGTGPLRFSIQGFYATHPLRNGFCVLRLLLDQGAKEDTMA